jgi:hypothetical protein
VLKYTRQLKAREATVSVMEGVVSSNFAGNLDNFAFGIKDNTTVLLCGLVTFLHRSFQPTTRTIGWQNNTKETKKKEMVFGNGHFFSM